MTKALGGNVLDWLDGRSAWQFLGILYVARWAVLSPIMVLAPLVFTQEQVAAGSIPEALRQGSPLGLFFSLVILSPVLETLLECAVPYWIVSWLRDYRRSRPRRSWGYVAIAAVLMGILHPVAASIPYALVTGAFLGYCYAHFAAKSTSAAVFATAAFHGAINLVGWTMLMVP